MCRSLLLLEALSLSCWEAVPFVSIRHGALGGLASVLATSTASRGRANAAGYGGLASYDIMNKSPHLAFQIHPQPQAVELASSMLAQASKKLDSHNNFSPFWRKCRNGLWFSIILSIEDLESVTCSFAFLDIISALIATFGSAHSEGHLILRPKALAVFVRDMPFAILNSKLKKET